MPLENQFNCPFLSSLALNTILQTSTVNTLFFTFKSCCDVDFTLLLFMNCLCFYLRLSSTLISLFPS